MLGKIVKHMNCTILLSISEAQSFQSDFISVKISCSDERVSFAVVVVEH